MAGAGYKLFNTGDVLLASEVNTYLMQQTVMVFADSAARTTALSGVLAEGMLSYLADTNATEVYDGSSWVSVSGTGDITAVTTGANSGLAGGVTTGNADIKINFASKGQLAVGTGSGTTDFLNVGTNGYTIVADSGETTGLKWAPVSSNFTGCSLTKSADQTISNSSNTILTWDQESFDVGGFHDNVTNNSRITIPSGKGGKYLFVGNVYWAANTTGIREHWFTVNDSSVARHLFNASSADNSATSLSVILNLVATDYVEFRVKQTSGGNLNFDNSFTYFSCVYLGA